LREVAEERDRALAEVEAAIKIRDDFLAAASHDLKNPLAAVRGTAQILQRTLNRSGAVPPERLAEGLQSIITSAGQMTSLIDGLLDVTRLQVGQQLTLQRHPTDLVTLVTRAASTFQQSTDRHRLRVVLPAPTGGEGDQDGHGRGVSLVGEWDEGRLERVIGNLLSNAIKYSPEGGEITISVGWEAPGPAPASEAADGWAVLRVRDQGVGIPAADLPRVFDRFSRGGNVVGRISGSGFGLSVARQIVEGHGGTISVESDLGQGSTFTVRLPL
jgi:signal transduction histidine kinase